MSEPHEAEHGVIKQCQELWTTAAQEVALVANQGSFKISREAERILGLAEKALRRVPEEGQERQWLLNTALELAVAITALSTEAKRDLSVLGLGGRFMLMVGERGSLRRQTLTGFWPRGHDDLGRTADSVASGRTPPAE